jgi:hypothetical protein
MLSKLFTMAKSADTVSNKSSIISGKTAALKKTVKTSAKAITRPFKKLKQSLSVRSDTRSVTSRSSTAFPPSDHEADLDDTASAAENGSAHGGSNLEVDEPEVELTPEQELGSSLFNLIAM